MSIDDLTKSTGEWLRGVGPMSDVVVSSRIRLARNLAEHPFLSTADATVKKHTGLLRLRRELQEAIEQENFERAARVRDQIRTMEN